MGRAGRARAASALHEKFVDELKRLENESGGGRLGVTLLDTGTGQRVGQRMDERFPMCSTFKVLASGAVLQGVDAGKENLARRIYFSEADLVTYSPETQKHVGPNGMTVAELCKAAITLSDNTAGNLLLASIGGPQGLTAFVRASGRRHDASRPHRDELNEALPGDPRDTTTPNAMASDLRALVLGDGCRRNRALNSRAGSPPIRPAASACAPDCRPRGASATKPGPASGERRMMLL